MIPPTSRTMQVLLMLILALMIMVAVLNIFAGTISFDSKKKRAIERDEIVYFTHVHKSGGTTMCKTAQANGEEVNRDNNCNMKGDGPWTITEKSLSRTCEERYQLAKEEGYSFVAMERFLLEDELDCKDRFVYILMVRDPEQRHNSHVDVHRHGVLQDKHRSFVGRKKKMKTKKRKRSNYNTMATRRILRRRLKKRHVKSELGIALMDNYISGDNYLTRILIGERGFDGTLPIGSITDEHGEEAKKKLEQFDVILRLEKFEEDKVQLLSHLGWTEWIGVANARSKEVWDEESSESDRVNGPTTYELNNSVDLAVYEHARALAERLTARARTKTSSSL
uniref:Uncharacterized protein n=1 Tax=Minutocellus polymorphus TaxID=265543 RepID=A0A7S0AGF2_9STRA|mmetsp:Transcript_13474/g.22408  ORF Transcript_13474/g.22408 Transcript_13474/m.22408 type:complete len:337 (+) Transcript_13474:165-1175(+)